MSRLLVLHQGAIGDFLLTLGVVQSATQYLGAEDVAVIAPSVAARFAAGRSVISEWLNPEDLGTYRLFCRDLDVKERLAGVIGQADWVLNFMTGASGCVHERLSNLAAGEVVSVDPRPTAETRELRRHITQQWAADIRRAGWGIGELQAAKIRARSSAGGTNQEDAVTRRRCDAVMQSEPRVLIHPGSGGRGKCWPFDRYIALVESLAGMDVTWMIGPAEEDAARLLQDRSEPVLFEADLAKAAEQMTGFDVYVGNDGGMTHLAAALGLATVAIFGTTDPRIWRPLGDHVSVVAPEEVQETMDCVGLEEVKRVVFGRLRPSLYPLPKGERGQYTPVVRDQRGTPGRGDARG